MTERAKYWSDLVAAWSQSGLSQAEFCRRRDIKVANFAWWKRQLHKAPGDLPKRPGPPVNRSGRFVELHLTGTSWVPAYEIVLARGRSIRLAAQFDPQILSRLIAAVESC